MKKTNTCASGFMYSTLHTIFFPQNHLCSSIMDKRIRISQRRLWVFCALHIIRKNEILNTFQESRCVYCCSKGWEQCLFLMAAWLQHYRLHKACSLNCIKTNRVVGCSQEFRAQLICLSLLTLKYILLGEWGEGLHVILARKTWNPCKL